MKHAMRVCHVLTPVHDAGDGKAGYVEDKEALWLLHGWGQDSTGETCAILEAECGKVALVPAHQVRLLGVEEDDIAKLQAECVALRDTLDKVKRIVGDIANYPHKTNWIVDWCAEAQLMMKTEAVAKLQDGSV